MSKPSRFAPRLIVVRAFPRGGLCGRCWQAGARLILEQKNACPGNKPGFACGGPHAVVIVAAPRDTHHVAALQRHAHFQRGHRAVQIDVAAVPRAVNPPRALPCRWQGKEKANRSAAAISQEFHPVPAGSSELGTTLYPNAMRRGWQAVPTRWCA